MCTKVLDYITKSQDLKVWHSMRCKNTSPRIENVLTCICYRHVKMRKRERDWREKRNNFGSWWVLTSVKRLSWTKTQHTHRQISHAQLGGTHCLFSVNQHKLDKKESSLCKGWAEKICFAFCLYFKTNWDLCIKEITLVWYNLFFWLKKSIQTHTD